MTTASLFSRDTSALHCSQASFLSGLLEPKGPTKSPKQGSKEHTIFLQSLATLLQNADPWRKVNKRQFKPLTSVVRHKFSSQAAVSWAFKQHLLDSQIVIIPNPEFASFLSGGGKRIKKGFY